MEKAGNDADTASLLIALYRAANIPCRYVQGTIDIPMEKARSLTGVDYDNNVGRIFACAGIPVWITSSGKIRFEHTWVEAFVDYIPYAGAKAGEGDTWVPLSPWYKFYDHEDNLDLVSLTGFDRETFLEGFIARVKKEDPIDSYKMFFENYFKENDPDHNWQDGLRTRTLKEERFRTLPCTENFKVISYNGEYAELPDSDRHKVNVSVPEVSLTHIFNVCEIVGKKITYSYPPADQASKDLIDTSGGIENVYPLSVTLLPSLKVEGQTVATGSVVNAGFDHSLRTTFVVPSFSPDSVVYSVISGGYYALGLDPQYVSNKYLVDRIANGMSTVEDTPETTENMDDITGEALYLALMKYFNDRNQGDKTFAQLQKVVFLKETSGAIMGKTYEVINEWSGLPFDLEPGGYILDSKRDMNTPISVTGDADREKDLMYLRGYNSSFNEHDVLEDFFHLEAVSTVKLLAIANERGMPIYDIDSSNISSILPLLGHSDSIKTAIQNAANQGHTVKVHQDPLQVKEWTGCGYIHRDPITHAAGYMISGDHAGAITARNKLISLVVFRLGFGPHEGDPVNIASGNLFYGEEDLSFPSVGNNITIHRFYNSLADDNGPFGYGWSFTYDEIISEDPVDQSITYRAYDGSVFKFTRNPDGTYENPPGMCCSTLTKDENGFLIRKKCGTRHFFDTEGKLTSIVDRNENAITLSYNTDGKLSAVTDASGSELVFAYNMNNKIESINGPGDNNTIIYTYNGDELVSATNSAGHTVIYAYDGGHKMTSWTNAAGATVAFDYYNDGRVHTNLLPNGGSYLFSYNSPLRITTVTGPEGNSSVHYYNNWGETTGYLDPLGFEELYEYDENLNKIKIIDKRGGITKFTYDSSGNLLTKTDPLNHTTTYSYDPDHNRVAAFTDPGGNITTYNYDTNGNLKISVDSEGITTEIEYYTNGLMKNFKKAGVKQVEFIYFPNGKIETIMEATGNTITFTYDELGRITSRTDGIGNTTTYQHDGAGNIVKATDVKGNETFFAYNELNLRTSMTDASGNVITYEYNSWGELEKEINAQGHGKTFSYNLNGDPATETDENGNTTTYYYDLLQRLSKKVYSDGSEESYTYDPNANLISVTDAKCNTTSYLYDVANRHTQEVYSDGATYTYEYDAVGNKISKTDPNGNTIIFTYDGLKRLTGKSYPDGTTENYTYDAQGGLMSGTNADSHLSYTYDEMGRITQGISGMSDNKTVNYDYDAVGNRIFLTTPEGEIVEYGYDNSGLMTEMKLSNGKGIDYTYDSLRRIVRKDYFGGSYSTYDFDDAGRLIQINHLRSDSNEIYTQNNIFDNRRNF
jgi:YD repeat-containing protein